jgi:hypothetical protein
MPEEKKPSDRRRRGLEYNIKIHLQYIYCETADRMQMIQDRIQTLLHKRRGNLDQLSDYQLFKKDSAPWT